MTRVVSSARVLVGVALALMCAAPTVGDVGGCGADATELDEAAFARARKLEDCRRCRDCGFTTPRCTRACDLRAPTEVDWPVTCRPLLHDGEVCIRALRAASCTSFASYVDEQSPTTPSECQFCRVPPPAPAFGDASAEEAGP